MLSIPLYDTGAKEIVYQKYSGREECDKVRAKKGLTSSLLKDEYNTVKKSQFHHRINL
jgi:hypothetical protein